MTSPFSETVMFVAAHDQVEAFICEVTDLSDPQLIEAFGFEVEAMDGVFLGGMILSEGLDCERDIGLPQAFATFQEQRGFSNLGAGSLDPFAYLVPGDFSLGFAYGAGAFGK